MSMKRKITPKNQISFQNLSGMFLLRTILMVSFDVTPLYMKISISGTLTMC